MGSSRHTPGWDVLQMSEYARPFNKAEVTGLAKCNALEARAVPLSLPQALCRGLLVTSSGPPRPAPSGSRRGKGKDPFRCRRMSPADADYGWGPLDDSNRPLSISVPFPVGLRSSKGRGRICQEDNPRLIGYSRRRDAVGSFRPSTVCSSSMGSTDG